jgi:hypothetical protein
MTAGTADVSTRYVHTYVQSGHPAGATLQTSCAWEVTDVPGMGHDGKPCPPPQRQSCLRQCMHWHREGNTTDALSGLRLRWR